MTDTTTQQRPRVFFVQKAERFDTSPADAFGDRHYLLSPYVSAFNIDAYTRELVQSLGEYEYDPDRDYVAITGQTISVAFMVGIILSLHGRMRVLLFDARSGEYAERILTKPATEVNA